MSLWSHIKEANPLCNKWHWFEYDLFGNTCHYQHAINFHMLSMTNNVNLRFRIILKEKIRRVVLCC